MVSFISEFLFNNVTSKITFYYHVNNIQQFITGMLSIGCFICDGLPDICDEKLTVVSSPGQNTTGNHSEEELLNGNILVYVR